MKVFHMDRLIRDDKGRPIGRVVLAQDYDDTDNKIPVATLTVPTQYRQKLAGMEFYIDDELYRVPLDLHPLKQSRTKLKLVANSFYIEKVNV